jgi:hypothetical protein
MKNLAVIGFVTIGMLAAVACGKPSKGSDDKAGETNTTSAGLGAAKASCDMSGEVGSCNEYRNGSTFGLEKSLCEGFKGKFSMTPCATTNQVGSCALTDGEVKRYYAGSGLKGYSLEDAKSDCESELLKGKFTADPAAAAKAAEPAPKAAAPAAKPAAKPKKK